MNSAVIRLLSLFCVFVAPSIAFSSDKLPAPFRLIPEPVHVEVRNRSGLAYGVLKGVNLKGDTKQPIMGTILSNLIEVDKEDEGVLILSLTNTRKVPESSEGYVLTIYDNKVEISSRGDAGLFYGCQSLEQFDIALKSQPNNSELWEGVGYVKRRQGEFEKALMNLKKAAELDPRSSGILYNLGNSYTLMRDYPKAELIYDRAISLAPDFPWLYTAKTWLYVRWQGSIERAREVLKEASEKVDREDLVLTGMWLDVFDRDYEAALERLSLGSLETYESESEFSPKSLLYAQIYGFINQSKLEQVYYDSARVILERNLQEQPGDARFHSSLGIAYAGLGRTDEAIREGKLAVELFPVSKDALKGVDRLRDLAQIYVMVGQYNDAIDQFEFLLSIPGMITISLLRLHPICDPLRDHPRFQKLVVEQK